ncbi:hypothetical protein [Leeuwenhoekiella sp. ZYFB001]|uniref:hypothetical protein n=1 Tax=Leeuwenhoekiella sp. ZYFB001 TaxID=2719912 RepID=UPI00142FC3D3|nr:hypothetical protein [Leeuwenhoekiella sp. ZYFB001]
MSQEKPELKPVNGEVTFMMPSTNALGALKKAEKGRQLTVSYKKKEEWLGQIGQPVKCFFLGLKEATDGKGDTYFIAKLHDGEKAFVCAQTVLVQSLMSTELGQGVEITCTGSSKTNGNEIPLFEVVELNINITKGDE